MKKQNMVYPCNGILPSYIKRLSTDAHYNMDEPRRLAKWKKTDARDHILYNSIYVKCPK